MIDGQEHISKVELCLKESLKVFGYDTGVEGGLKHLMQAIEKNEKI